MVRRPLLAAYVIIGSIALVLLHFGKPAAASQFANPIAQVSSTPPTITVQAWAQAWKEENCGKRYASAVAERDQPKPDVMLSMTDMNLFWGCVEMNKQVNASK